MNLENLTAKVLAPATITYTPKDTMLCALGIGAGSDPLEPVDLRFTYEKDLVALPTLPCVLASPRFWMHDPALEMGWLRILYGEQAIELYTSLPAEGTIKSSYRITGVKDRGEEKGATRFFEKLLAEEKGDAICAAHSTYILHGDGGCGDFGPAMETPAPLPDRPPDHVIEIPTLARQALLYRLNGDFSPLHSDPEVARKAGFDRPIMHGFGSMGIVGHALAHTFCDGDPAHVAGMSLRFASPSFLGETIALECYEEGQSFRFGARAAGRNAKVLDRGTFTLKND